MRGRDPRPHASTTFCVAGHHYALVIVDGLEPGSTNPSTRSRSTASRRWPEPDSEFPPSVIRTLGGDGPLRLCFGSCRVSLPHHAPVHAAEGRSRRRARVRRALLADQGDARAPIPSAGRTPCCCSATRSTPTRSRPRRSPSSASAATSASRPARRSPTSRSTRASTASRGRTRRSAGCSRPSRSRWSSTTTTSTTTGTSPPPGSRTCASSTGGPSASAPASPPTGSISSSATSRRELLRESELLARVREADDGWEILREVADNERGIRDGARWSYCRDLGRTRLIVLDSRCGRVLEEGKRSMLDDGEWEWLERAPRGRLRPPADRHLRSVPARARACTTSSAGARRSPAGPGDRAPRSTARSCAARSTSTTGRRSAIRSSASRVCCEGRASGEFGARAGLDHGALGRRPSRLSGGGRLPALGQGRVARLAGGLLAVSQRARRPRAQGDRLRQRARPARRSAATLARLAGVAREPIRWRLVEGPFFDNQVATLTFDGRRGGDEARAHGRRPRDRPPRAAHVVRAVIGAIARPDATPSVPAPYSTGLPFRFHVPTPPLPTWITRSKPSRWRIEAARPLRLPPLQTAAIGRSRGQLAEALERARRRGCGSSRGCGRRRTRRRRGRRGPATRRRRREPVGELVGVDRLDPLHRPPLRAPGGHPAGEEAAHPQPDRGEQVGGRELVAVGGGDDDQLDVGRRRPGRPWWRSRCRRRRR